MGITACERTINPKQAESLLANHINYRRVNNQRADAYTKAMLDGNWGMSVLVMDDDGRLCDGQTRLMAVIKSGKQQRFVVVSGWPTDQVKYLDNGQSRTPGQTVKAERGDIKDANKVMAIVTSLKQFGRSNLVLNYEALRLYDLYQDLASETMSVCAHGSIRSAVHIIPFCRAIIRFPNRKGEILEALARLSSIRFSEEKDEGLRLYYSWVISHGFNGGGSNVRKEAYLKCSRAILAYLDDTAVTKLYAMKDDPFEIK